MRVQVRARDARTVPDTACYLEDMLTARVGQLHNATSTPHKYAVSIMVRICTHSAVTHQEEIRLWLVRVLRLCHSRAGALSERRMQYALLCPQNTLHTPAIVKVENEASLLIRLHPCLRRPLLDQ